MELEINIPSSLNEITLGQYQEFVRITKNDDSDDVFINHKLIQIFCGVELGMVSKMRQRDINEIVETVNNLFKSAPPLKMRFEFKGKEFGLIPNLDDMSAGEYMDLDGYIDNWDQMHNAMAVLFRPITNKFKHLYQIEEYKGSSHYADLMKDLPMDIVLGVHVFFFNLGNELLKSTMRYSQQEAEALLTKQHNLEKGGDGINQSMLLRKEMYDDLMKLPSFHLINA